MSPRAACRLESLGFSEVYDYVAGKKDWFDAGLPMEGEIADAVLLGHRARRDMTTCRPDGAVGELAARASVAGWDQAAVVNDANVLQGWLSGETLSDRCAPGTSQCP